MIGMVAVVTLFCRLGGLVGGHVRLAPALACCVAAIGAS